MPTFALYFYPSCYFCRLVQQTMSQLGIDVELRDIHQDPSFREELVAERGRTTVPVLRIEHEGKVQWMPESQDIIQFLKTL